MKAAATSLLGIGAGILSADLVLLYGLDRLSADHHLFATWHWHSPDGKQHRERYIQFTNEPGTLLFGFKAEEGQADFPPFSMRVARLTQSDFAARKEHQKTPEGQRRQKFTLGFSRMIANPKGKHFYGDYVSIRIRALYVAVAMAILTAAGLIWILNRKPEPAHPAEPSQSSGR